MKNLISIKDLHNKEIDNLFSLTNQVKKEPQFYANHCIGKNLALPFFEPSTRTYFSFATAIRKLGGDFIGFNSPANTSSSKGESIEDTIKTISYYCDIMAIRYHRVNTLSNLANIVNIPIISAGEGTGEHPSQTLIDLYTIYESFPNRQVTIGLYGDLKYGRTNHSLMMAAARFNTKFICIAPSSLQMPEEYINYAIEQGSRVEFAENLEDVYKQLDVVYITRIQQERIADSKQYESFKKTFKINKELVAKLNYNSIIMHPLPRLEEISRDVDNDHRAKYFTQIKNSVPVRMAIIMQLLRNT